MIKSALITLLALAPGLGRAQSVVCAGKIIREGVTKAQVAAAYGTPTQVGNDAHEPAIGKVGVGPGSASWDARLLAHLSFSWGATRSGVVQVPWTKAAAARSQKDGDVPPLALYRRAIDHVRCPRPCCGIVADTSG